MSAVQNGCQQGAFRAFLEMANQACLEYNVDQMLLAGKIYKYDVPIFDQQRMENHLREKSPNILQIVETIKSDAMPSYSEAKLLRYVVCKMLTILEQRRSVSPITVLINGT